MCHLAPLRDWGGLRQVFSQTNYKHSRGQAVTSLGKQEKTNGAPPHSPTGRTWGGLANALWGGQTEPTLEQGRTWITGKPRQELLPT